MPDEEKIELPWANPPGKWENASSKDTIYGVFIGDKVPKKENDFHRFMDDTQRSAGRHFDYPGYLVHFVWAGDARYGQVLVLWYRKAGE